MKKVFIYFSLILFVFQFDSVNNIFQDQTAAEIKFDKTMHDFGEIKKGTKDLVCKFEYKNVGNDMLFITRIVKSCGCTEPKYSKEPLMPGQTAIIEVGYTATDEVTSFNKKLTVFSNAETESVILTIKGRVVN